MDLGTFLSANFFHVAPILLFGAIGIAIILERYVALYVSYPLTNSQEFFKRIATLVSSSKINDAVSACDQYSQKAITQILRAGLMRAHLPETSIQDGLQIALHQWTQRILQRTSFLATIANVSTLMGLLGTILGLIQSFEAVGHADAQQKAALLSAGIATAMNATMLGLGVAIPCMIAYSFLMSQSNQLIGTCEEAAAQASDILKQRFFTSEYLEAGASKGNRVASR